MKKTVLIVAFVLGLIGPAISLTAQELTGDTPPVVIPTNQLPVPVVTVRAADPYASEPGVLAVVDNGVFVVSRSHNTNIDLTVHYRLTGTASNGVDYVIPTETPGRAVIPKGKLAVELRVRALMDNIPEGVEKVVLRLEPIFCIAIYPPPPECYQIGQPAEAVVYINDYPPAEKRPWIRIDSPVNGQMFPTGSKVPIHATAVDPEGYFHTAEFFADGKIIGTSTVAFFRAPTNGSPVPFHCTWSNAPAGRHTLTAQTKNLRGIAVTSAPVNIVVGELPPPPAFVSVRAAEPLAIEGTNCWGWWNFTNRYPEGAVQYTSQVAGWRPIWWYTNCGPKSATFVIARAGSTNEDLRVFFRLRGSATNGVDYVEVENNVVIPAGARKAEVLIVPKDDAVIEPPETVILELVPPMYASLLPEPYTIVWPGRAGAVIIDSARPYLRPGILADRSFYVGMNAIDGAWYRLEHSTNMLHWRALCTNQVVQGSLNFVDPDVETSKEGFYRAAPVEPPVE